MEIIKINKKVIIVIMIIIFTIGIISVLYFTKYKAESIDISNFVGEEVNNENCNLGDIVEDVNKVSENNEKNENGFLDNENNIEKIYIHIIGEVNNQGVIELDKGDRIVDAIEKAGGATMNADLSKINLAFILDDGLKVKIPSINDKSENEIYVTDGSGNEVSEGEKVNSEIQGSKKININTANQTELETLSGIGPSLAASIIEFRNKNGLFKNIDELKNVSGIGEAKFNKIKNNVRVK